MNRRSPAVMWNPWLTGATDCALTAGTKTGPPTGDTSIATSVTIAHRFLERTPRHVNGLITRMISSWRGRSGATSLNARGR
jgi:hypothetical protein